MGIDRTTEKPEGIRGKTALGRCSCSSVILTDREHSCDFRIAVVGMTCSIRSWHVIFRALAQTAAVLNFYSASCKEAPHLRVDFLSFSFFFRSKSRRNLVRCV